MSVSYEINRKTKINYNQVNYIDLAKKYLNISDLKESEFYLNLSLMNSKLDINDKIYILSLKSFIYYKSNNELLSNISLKKIMKIYKTNKTNIENKSIFVRIFYRSGSIFYENRKYFLSLHCFYLAKNLLEEGDRDILKNEETLDIVMEKFNKSICEIEKIVK